MSKCVAVMPIGPACKPEFVADTLASIRAFTPPGTRIVLIDDSKKDTARVVADGDCRVIRARRSGTFGSLYINLSDGFREALQDDFDVLLRIDTDAIVAAEFIDACVAFFSVHPTVGSVGSYRYGYQGTARSFSWARRRLLRAMTLDARSDPEAARVLWRTVRAARSNGYRLGENVMGGVAVYSRRAVETLSSSDLLPNDALARTGLQEDQIFAIALRACGFKLADFGSKRGEAGPFATKHIGMPAHPQQLIDEGKSLIHSTRSFGDMDEASIRSVFAAARS
jgi:glycosyltransferase involved in cell wall biosynthesis